MKSDYVDAFLPLVGSTLVFTPEKRSKFCDELAGCGNMARAAMACGVTTTTVRQHMQDDRTFADAVQLAKDAFASDVEAELVRRAMEGITDYKLDNKGNIVLKIKKYSDRLLELLIKKTNPEYADKSQLDVNVKGGLLVLTATKENADEWKERHDAAIEVSSEKVE